LCSHHRRQPDPTKQFCRVEVGGVKWVLVSSVRHSGTRAAGEQMTLSAWIGLYIWVVASRGR